ncbi:MAG: F0F1 ATP synthase subunit A [Acidithiobacillus sp.]|jgi:F-type H+-transporting ATPase subunit a|uniref:F0F1 ATP synthase subunit A n=1 Tax=Acidithiobacillus ferriphilus TaxID=1689834 RepID=UPI002314964F|nr:F0F1 ATP synthase subunit A [Acidithiobacillus ferriphilus]MBW9248261.1 F0F1 ATP synthase subunit A [Acidithiobacillus ferriphilus]MBW9254150.1 F0F1 ATP synthase subunit A [Acidithiobacillus ferriphilus]MDA8151198.1 F0F1 ATP synthase subunit A [Acidithiobacillus sp.]
MQQSTMTSVPVLQIGPLSISGTVLVTWVIMAVLGGLSWAVTRHLQAKPGMVQTAAEGIVSTMENAIHELAPEQTTELLPFIGSLWIFLVVANLSGLIPGVHSPTDDLSATSALAILVFFSVHWFGIRNQGIKGYLRHYLSPTSFLLPFNILSEITRTLTLAVRLFGNMMSLELAALLIVLVAGLLVPIPILMLHIVEALVQAYIFGMLALVYIVGGIQQQERTPQERSDS